MSLKARLVALIVALVTVVVAAMALVHLNSLIDNWSRDVLERSELAGQQVKSFLLQRITERTQALRTPPATIDETKRVWAEMVASDQDLTSLLVQTLAHAEYIVEIVIAGEDGRVLAGSNTARKSLTMTPRPPFRRWREEGLLGKIDSLFARREYEVAIPLGLAGERRALFTIQVVVSSVLLKETLLAQLQTLGVVSLALLLLAIVLGVFLTNLALGPLDRISQTIDRISRGQDSAPAPPRTASTATREFAVVEDKLNVLGQQFRGAREDVTQLRSSVEHLLGRLEEVVLLFDPDGRLVLVSSSAERILGMARPQMAGRQLEELFPPSTPLGMVIQAAIRQKEAVTDRLVSIEEPGKPPMRLLANVEPLEAGTLVTLRDVETRRQLASQLDVSTRLAAISRLTGGVAHEIKNPLNAIALRLELLRARLDDGHPEAQSEIAIIAREITRLDRVVKTFLDFTRPVDLVIQQVDLAAMVRDISALVAPQAAAQNVVVECVAGEGRVVVGGDRDLLKQAILNVVVNGIEAMKQGGKLELAVRAAADHCLVEIADQGPGIPPESREKVFQLYFTTKERGSGIGLAMAYRAVQLHNGTIDFSNQLGGGTTFRLRFPLSVPPEAGRR